MSIDQSGRTRRGPALVPGDVLKAALAAGGLLAAFGVASCCALPLLLAGLGLGSASLLGVALIAGPYQGVLLLAAGACLLLAVSVMWRQHRARVCAATAPGRNTALDWTSKGAVLLALGLLALALWIEPPL